MTGSVGLDPAPPRRRLRIATVSLAGCFGCHTGLLDIDEALLELADRIELDRSPLTDIKRVGPCDVGLIEGGLCNAENVETLLGFRAACRVLVAVGACAITGGLPALRNGRDVGALLHRVYADPARPGLGRGVVPDDPELPLLLDRVRPVHEVVHVDHVLPGCPPPADAFRALLAGLLDGTVPEPRGRLLRYD